jgi:hypothetical protein
MGFLAKLMDTHRDSGTDYNKFTLLSDNESNDVTIADYVVEQDTSGNWTYRKWNSGIVELWGAQSFTTRQGWDANDLIISFPFSIQRIISQDVSQADYRIEVCYLNSATTTTIKLNAKASVAGTYGFTFRLVGRWK